MQVRDRTKKPTEYKGRWTDAADEACPCRRCFTAHDCGRFVGGLWSRWMECATRHNEGCPEPKPEPEHILERSGRCKRCGFWFR